MKHYKRMLNIPFVKMVKKAEERAIRSLLEGKYRRALDIGCGFGYYLNLLEERAETVVGCDISRQIEHSSANLTLCNAVNLPFKKDSFDLVLMIGVLDFYKNADVFLDEAVRVCNGTLIVTFPIKGLLSFLSGLFWKIHGLEIHGKEKVEIQELITKYLHENSIESVSSKTFLVRGKVKGVNFQI